MLAVVDAARSGAREQQLRHDADVEALRRDHESAVRLSPSAARVHAPVLSAPS